MECLVREDAVDKRIKVDLALVHYPVVNKNSEIIGSAVTNLDVHDLARACRTFGINNLYLVTPFRDQQRMIGEILDHWLTGYGSEYNSNRKDALSIVKICDDLEQLFAEVTEKWHERPIILATSARQCPKTWAYEKVREKIFAGDRFLILFGTAWGLSPVVIESLDGTLPPLSGFSDYNHLAVRSAAAIILDRLLGDWQRKI
ncbi:MAG: hypothetical protein A2511_07415 [Deltaproteobacteria bacterium RIFOXYD12_FULL_50_9]|nr:MAG: hypothetical protein A2511_07415 [Deltaproteobacteria bacterium RIFOXYD12_FULL_50_9]